MFPAGTEEERGERAARGLLSLCEAAPGPWGSRAHVLCAQGLECHVTLTVGVWAVILRGFHLLPRLYVK